jgi:hypothetical protein
MSGDAIFFAGSMFHEHNVRWSGNTEQAFHLPIEPRFAALDVPHLGTKRPVFVFDCTQLPQQFAKLGMILAGRNVLLYCSPHPEGENAL